MLNDNSTPNYNRMKDYGLQRKPWSWTSWAKRLAGLALIVAVPVTAFGSPSTSPLLHATADKAAAVSTKAPSAASGYGISATFDDLSAAQLDGTMAAIHATGATWLRYDLSWNEVAGKGPGHYDWSTPDRVTAAANKYHLQVVMAIGLTPSSQRTSGCASERCAPADPQAYAAFAGMAAARYKSQGVHDWEIWNEPNIAYRFGPTTDPVKYVAMLKDAYPVIKQADPSAVVIAASTAPAASHNGDLSPIDFLKAMYANGAAGSFDAISTHPYIYPILPSQASPADAWGQLPQMHEAMAAHGDGAKQIWITEYGAPTNGPNKPDEYVSEATQAQMLTEATMLFSQFPWSGPFMWYEFQDSGTSTATSENFYGLIRADGSHKPSYDAFLHAINN